MHIGICNPITDPRWRQLVEDHPSSSVYQHPLYMKALAETYAHLEPLGFILTDDHGNVAAGIPFFLVKSWLTGSRLVSLPFSSYSDPLVRTQEEFQLLFQEVLRFYANNHVGYLEFKLLNGIEFFQRNPSFAPSCDQKTHILELSQDTVALQKRFDRTNVRQKISRAEKSGIIVRGATTEEELRAFYELLLKSRRRLGLPPQFFTFFVNLWRLLYPVGILSLLSAEMNGSRIGFLLFLKHKTKIFTEYIASEESMFPLGVNQALFWEAIKRGISGGYRLFDFGKSSTDNIGLLSAKGRWGAVERNAPTVFYPGSKKSAAGHRGLPYKLVSRLYKRMPTAVSKMSSGFLYRHMG